LTVKLDLGEETGGDDPQKAADLVLELMGDRAAGVTGRFLWIKDGLQAPLQAGANLPVKNQGANDA
jgi:hypothetical protein